MPKFVLISRNSSILIFSNFTPL